VRYLPKERASSSIEEATHQVEEATNVGKANHLLEEFARQAPETKSAKAKQEKLTKGLGWKEAKVQVKQQKEKLLEERRQREMEEQQHLEEERQHEEEKVRQEQEKQICLDEELSWQEQERLDHKALLEQECLNQWTWKLKKGLRLRMRCSV
jgi:hypothetical protein